MNQLKKYNLYSRKEVHDTFEPYTNFNLRAGSWGLWGIIKLKKREIDRSENWAYGRYELDGKPIKSLTYFTINI